MKKRARTELSWANHRPAEFTRPVQDSEKSSKDNLRKKGVAQPFNPLTADDVNTHYGGNFLVNWRISLKIGTEGFFGLLNTNSRSEMKISRWLIRYGDQWVDGFRWKLLLGGFLNPWIRMKFRNLKFKMPSSDRGVSIVTALDLTQSDLRREHRGNRSSKTVNSHRC